MQREYIGAPDLRNKKWLERQLNMWYKYLAQVTVDPADFHKATCYI
jgi:hypothetical protein